MKMANAQSVLRPVRKDVLDKFKSTLDKATKQLYDKTLDYKDIQEVLSVSYDIYKIIKEQ